MAKREQDERPTSGDRAPRTPVKMEDVTREQLREIALLWLRDSIEKIGGELLDEAVASLYKRGRASVVADFIKKQPKRARENGLVRDESKPKR